ncbi:MAG TPA: cobalamin biosynthesis protein CobG [Novosphingobium sp.]|nr:cobalamin biosynthesis protein CobG [Novosphingobium sp.]
MSGGGKSGVVRGWCPDAWRPMMSGDGLLVRVKPPLARLAGKDLGHLREAAIRWGNGLVDVTRRGNVQIRGVRENRWRELLEWLIARRLVDADPVRERRRNVLVAPDWAPHDETARIGQQLLDRLDELPELPGKVGFVIDAGRARALAVEPGDFRLERGESGGLIVRAQGRATGVHVAPGHEVDGLVALARWFVASGGPQAGRMGRHKAELPGELAGNELPAPMAQPPAPGRHPLGNSFGVPFGRLDADMLAGLAACDLRVTPWRMLLIEGAGLADLPGLISQPADPLLRADACPGAPGCGQSTVETRDLASLLAPLVKGHLHVSGCEKGCALSRPADVTVTGRDGLYDLAFQSGFSASALGRADLLAHFGAA